MTRPKLIIMCGLPGSGKTTYANIFTANRDVTHLSSDSIRKELYGDESIQGDCTEVFSLMNSKTLDLLNQGSDVIYDATNLTRKSRKATLDICPTFVRKECCIVWDDIEECIRKDSQRDRTVGKEVIDRMAKSFQAPYYDEGFEHIAVIQPPRHSVETYIAAQREKMSIPHDNPHHTRDVLYHCFGACQYVIEHTGRYDEDLSMAAMYHDVGKPYTKTFTNSKGEPCEEAHYYGHQSVGAWISYGITTPYNSVHLAWLISTHMDPFLSTKYYRRLPDYLRKQVDLLYEADRNAH